MNVMVVAIGWILLGTVCIGRLLGLLIYVLGILNGVLVGNFLSVLSWHSDQRLMSLLARGE